MIEVGDLVSCKLYNKPESKYYGERWSAVILRIDPDHYEGGGQVWYSVRHWKPFLIKSSLGVEVWLSCREIGMKADMKNRWQHRLRYDPDERSKYD